ncbi:MAG: CatB-related O-acetyltransferase [Desulfarculaceae bacterium]|nr:CatB-related O-acetyltransferase [Desulfarculaceae bacterium]
MEIGDFSYFGHLEVLEDYAGYLAPYLFPLSPEKLVIGKFCQLAHGVRIITSSANHDMSGFSTFPFNNFTMTPHTTMDDIRAMFNVPGRKGDTVIGNDVWMGMNATIMPGVTVGDGAIISVGAVVARDVEPYTIVGGNPAQPLKKRFDEATIQALLEIRWWDWPVEKIEANIDAITSADIEKLREVAKPAA